MAIHGERKAAASAYNGTCVLVGTTSTEPHMITVRDSKEVSGLVTRLLQCLTFTPDEWRAFLDGAKKGEFDLDEAGHLPQGGDVLMVVSSARAGPGLHERPLPHRPQDAR